VVVATKEYAAPEVLRGQPAGPAADVWSLGVILHELLTGDFPRESGALCGRPPDEPRRPSQCVVRPGGGLGRVVAKCLAVKPEDRYASGTQLAAELGRWARRKRTRRVVRRFGLPVAACVLVLAGLAYGAIPPGAADRYRSQIREAADGLARGESVTLIPATGRPPGHQIRVGDPDVVRSRVAPDGAFAVDSGAGRPALIELLDDPGIDRYRFSVDVREDEGYGESYAGLYYAAQVVPTDAGPVHLFGRLRFTELDPAADGWVRLDHCRLTPPGTTGANWASHFGSLKTYPAPQPGAPPAERWHRLAVNVTETGARAEFDGFPGGPNLDSYDFRLAQSWVRSPPAIPTGATSYRANVIPRGGLGLFVFSCRASFRNARVEPGSPTPTRQP
jgi:hypothetical protein